MSEDEQRRLDDDASAEDDPGAQPPEDADEMAFEDAIEELEAIVEELEDGDLPLEQAMARFERGLGLVSACRGKLERAELQVEELLEGGTTEELDEA
jgi:exodeoxyribonuclease VII small subunit